jgi:hypothetical protein
MNIYVIIKRTSKWQIKKEEEKERNKKKAVNKATVSSIFLYAIETSAQRNKDHSMWNCC